jgi:uncharacterized membrane protein
MSKFWVAVSLLYFVVSGWCVAAGFYWYAFAMFGGVVAAAYLAKRQMERAK